ncbi:hypothetical protein ACI2JA_19705 [Alkalihalobacillus sp. NPDC078783]
MDSLSTYLEENIGNDLYGWQKDDLIQLAQVKDERGRLLKSHTSINKYLQDTGRPYVIQAMRTNNQRYWIVLRDIGFMNYLKKFCNESQIEKLVHKMSLR